MAALGAIASIAGTIVGVAGAQYQAQAQANQLRYSASVKDKEGSEIAAAKQREAEQKDKEGRLLISRQRSVAASSGAGASDPGTLNLMAEAAGLSNLNSRTALYEGAARQQGLNDAAQNDRISADNALTAGKISSIGTIISGISSMASNFSGSGFQGASGGGAASGGVGSQNSLFGTNFKNPFEDPLKKKPMSLFPNFGAGLA
jgi:hypothetical protein